MKRPLTTPEEFFAETIRYYRNAKGILRTVPIHGREYANLKPLAEASAVAYKAIPYALNGDLLRHGWTPERLPNTVAGYLDALRRRAKGNGKTLAEFRRAYQVLDILACYRNVTLVQFVKPGSGSAKWIIEHLAGRRV